MRKRLIDSVLSLKVQPSRLALLLGLVLGGLVGLVPLVGQASHSDDQACTTETIRGEYGFRTAGVSVRPDGTTVEFASFGRMVRDGHGNVVSGMVTSNTGGTIRRVTLTGTYTVNSDCTGSGTSNLSSGAVVHYEFVIVDKGQRMEFILVEPNGIIGGTYTRL
jgi:hypothetical protein